MAMTKNPCFRNLLRFFVFEPAPVASVLNNTMARGLYSRGRMKRNRISSATNAAGQSYMGL